LTCTLLPQGFKNSPTIFGTALASKLKAFFFFIIIHMCIQALGNFSPLPPPPPLPPTPPPTSLPHPHNTWQKLFCHYL
jgi:hypothetical protein